MEIGGGRLGLNTNGIGRRVHMESIFINGEIRRHVNITDDVKVSIGRLGLDSDTVFRRVDMKRILING